MLKHGYIYTRGQILDNCTCLFKKIGMKFFVLCDIYRFCQLSKRNTLKKSVNDETVPKHHSEERLLTIETTQKPKYRLNKFFKQRFFKLERAKLND